MITFLQKLDYCSTKGSQYGYYKENYVFRYYTMPFIFRYLIFKQISYRLHQPYFTNLPNLSSCIFLVKNHRIHPNKITNRRNVTIR